MFNKFLILIILLFIPIASLKAEDIISSPSPEITEQIVLPSPTEIPLQEESPIPSLSTEMSPSPSPSTSPSPSPQSTPNTLPTFPSRKEIIPEFPKAPIPNIPAIPSPPPLPEFPKMPDMPKITKPAVKKPYKKIDFNKFPLPDFAD